MLVFLSLVTKATLLVNATDIAHINPLSKIYVTLFCVLNSRGNQTRIFIW